jgi:hypothetical protein
VNSEGCPFTRKIKTENKNIKEISVDDFEIVDENVGFLDKEQLEPTPTLVNLEENAISLDVENISVKERESLDYLKNLIIDE